MSNYLEIPFVENTKQISATDLKLGRAISFFQAVNNSQSSIPVVCYLVDQSIGEVFSAEDEIVVFDTSVEVGQSPINDIRYIERIAVHFTAKDESTPWVYALRKDFPSVSHLNSVGFRNPKCLCIYEVPFSELVLGWRSFKFLQDIRNWLKLTGEGKLHQEDQPREGFILSANGQIVFPVDIDLSGIVHIYLRSCRGNNFSFIALPFEPKDSHKAPYQLVHHRFEKIQESLLGYLPQNFEDIQDLFFRNDESFTDFLSQVFENRLKVFDPANKNLLDNYLLLGLEFRRDIGVYEKYFFITAYTVKEIGLRIRLFAEEAGCISKLIFNKPDADPNTLKNILVNILNPQSTLNRERIVELSPTRSKAINNETTIGLIGAGALGSNLLMNCARKGLGNWVVVDQDILLPHNFIRHALSPKYLLQPKSDALIKEASLLSNNSMQNISVWENYLNPLDTSSLEPLQKVELIIDISTSIPIARNLASRTDLVGKCVSIFLNPSGRDLVILAEDKTRRQPLDVLEFQYYRSLLYEKALANHFVEKISELRYGGGCSDVTTKLPQEYIAIHGGIASQKIENIIVNEDAFIGIWHIDSISLGITPVAVQVEDVDVRLLESGWTIKVDTFVLNKIENQRKYRLPNETGGILIGGFDFSRKIIYIIDTIVSPVDSLEYPNAYIRGIQGVKGELENISNLTSDHLKYVGEWHSHPDGYALDMSNDDTKLLDSIHSDMKSLDYPGLMLIAGANKSFELYLKV